VEAFLVVVVAVAVLGVGVLALLVLRRLRATMEPDDQAAGPTTTSRES
jgi:cation transporter-like permease